MEAAGHRAHAEEFLAKAGEWMDADEGWRGHMSTPERIARRTADLLAANAHASLYLAAQFGGEFDATAGVDRVLDEVKAGAHFKLRDPS